LDINSKIDEFIKHLQSVDDTDTIFNPYKQELQRNNLKKYLSYFVKHPPEFMMVGEAPGHNGCAMTGVPYTDDFRIAMADKSSVPPLADFSINDIAIDKREKITKENSSGAIWDVLIETQFFPLMWNVFPFHPHEVDKLSTNRVPTGKELRWSREFVFELQSIFSTIKHTYAIGKKALQYLDLPQDHYIRHPSYGGNIHCKNKILEIAKRCDL